MYVIVLFRTRKDASALTSAIVVAYNLYLQWSAMSSNPDQTCSPYTQSAGNTTGQLILGLFFTIVSLMVISASTTSNRADASLTNEMGSHMMEKEEETGAYN